MFCHNSCHLHIIQVEHKNHIVKIDIFFVFSRYSFKSRPAKKTHSNFAGSSPNTSRNRFNAATNKAFTVPAVMPISAKNGEGVEELLGVLEGFLPEGPQLFPEDMISDQPERQMMAEILREKLLLCLDKEIPHGTAVEITKFSERDDEVIEIDATIYCEKNSHKGIIIGKGGAMLKKISSLARQDMERFMGTKVFLQTWVKVKENWRDNVNLIRNFGYRDE